MTDFVLLTCEHGGNCVPTEYASLFHGQRELLQSHRGFDPGALDLARTCARRLHAPLHFAIVTRLLVDLNRSLGHRNLYSSVTKGLSPKDRESIARTYYVPYRSRVESQIAAIARRGQSVLHLSVHTFTPVLDGDVRRADVGLLYDPTRRAEAHFCMRLKNLLSLRRPDLIVRRNYPYQGTADGFTTALRKKWPDAAYAGIELEVNQRWCLGNRLQWRELRRDIAEILAETFVPRPIIDRD